MEFVESHPIAIFIGVAALLFGAVFYYNWKRRNDLKQLAASMGLLFSPDGPSLDELEASGMDVLRVGYSRKAKNLIEVPFGKGTIRVFDYRYTTGGGRHSHTHNFTLALIAASDIPEFDLKPESFIYKLGEMIGFKDIDLPAFPEFSQKYRLTGPDEHAVHLFFTPARAVWFEQNQGLHVQGGRGGLLYIYKDGRLPASDWGSFIEEAKIFASQILS